jgi:tetratricopeptide (TPR) repeat protein
VSIYDDIESHIRGGLFARALAVVEDEYRILTLLDECRHDVLHAELLYQTGQARKAAALAARTLSTHSPSSPIWRSRLIYVVGMCLLETGEYAEGLDHVRRAVRFADEAGDPSQAAVCQLALLRLTGDSDLAAAALLANVRKSTARSGDPHILIALRLHFARVEASRQSALESRRHLLAANRLLQDFPNVWLQGRVELGLAVVDSLTGELHGAVEHAHAAIDRARESGHARTELAGHVNLSHALHSIGRNQEAREAAETVLARSGADFEITIAALDSLANVHIAESQWTRRKKARRTNRPIAGCRSRGSSVPLDKIHRSADKDSIVSGRRTVGES